MKTVRKFYDKFTNDNELVRFKLTCVTIIMVIGEAIL